MGPLARPAQTADGIGISDDPASDAKDPSLQNESLKLLGLQPERNLDMGTWAFKFILVNGESEEVLSEFNRDKVMTPASTMKLFTGWYAFVNYTRSRRVKSLADLSHMLRHSDNRQADELFKAAGGEEALDRFLSQDPQGPGLPLNDDFNAHDGSGLDHDDGVTATIETFLLKQIHKSDKYETFKNCLGQPDKPSTVSREHHLQEFSGHLFAKTGTLGNHPTEFKGKRQVTRWDKRIDGVDALAGYIETRAGVVIFSIIGNGMTAGSSTGRDAIDKVVKLHVAAVMQRETGIPYLLLPKAPMLNGGPLSAPSF
jgi:D-alanyl-D-alanine carboxypeptidase